MITLDDYLMGRDKAYPIEDQMRADAEETTRRANLLLEAFGEERGVNSGYRPSEINEATPGASKKSNHMKCKAVDLKDRDRRLTAWCMANQEKLKELGLWLEHPDDTPTWCHVQIVPPGSGNRVFRA